MERAQYEEEGRKNKDLALLAFRLIIWHCYGGRPIALFASGTNGCGGRPRASLIFRNRRQRISRPRTITITARAPIRPRSDDSIVLSPCSSPVRGLAMSCPPNSYVQCDSRRVEAGSQGAISVTFCWVAQRLRTPRPHATGCQLCRGSPFEWTSEETSCVLFSFLLLGSRTKATNPTLHARHAAGEARRAATLLPASAGTIE